MATRPFRRGGILRMGDVLKRTAAEATEGARQTRSEGSTTTPVRKLNLGMLHDHLESAVHAGAITREDADRAYQDASGEKRK